MIDVKKLHAWCSVPVDELEEHPGLKVPFKMVADADALGDLIAEEFIEVVRANNDAGKPTRAIVPCGPYCWYEPFARKINERRVSLNKLTVFHMDECLDWQGRPLPAGHPYNFKSEMRKNFYGPIDTDLAVPTRQRFFPDGQNNDFILENIAAGPLDITLGGWGQDGHIAYNQARRHPFSHASVEDVRNSTLRVQENNLDTIITLAHRTFGAAYQFVPPMSVTLGVKECLSAKKVRVYSNTGTWKQTALRVALFSDEDAEYPLTLLQSHPDARITATVETAQHPIADNPQWQFPGVNA